jgi:hypothetical protein
MMLELKVASTLRFLAGGQVYDIADHYGFDKTTVYHAISQTMTAIL